MIEYNLTARLNAYTNGVFPTKVSELENDTPLVSTTSQDLTEEQQQQARDNISVFSKDETLQEVRQEQLAREQGIASVNRVIDTTVVPALEILEARVNLPDVDSETIMRQGIDGTDSLRATAIIDTLLDGTVKKVTPQEIARIETRLTKNEREIKRKAPLGGYITPYDFGWSGGTIKGLRAGQSFKEQSPTNPTEQREISVVESGGTYPRGATINANEAQIKALKYQVDLTGWAAEDIWNESYTRYGSEAFPVVLDKGKAITVLVSGLREDIPSGYYEYIGEDASGYKYGLWTDEIKVNIGRFKLVDDLVEEQEVWLSYSDITDFSTGLYYFWNNGESDRAIILYGTVKKNTSVESGIDWSEALVYWKGHSPTEIFNGTRCINSFNGWIWDICNTQDSAPAVFEWNLAYMGEDSIGFASESIGGVVKSANTESINGIKRYGILLDDDKKMYVDGLGEDLKAKEEARQQELQELYNILLEEGHIE